MGREFGGVGTDERPFGFLAREEGLGEGHFGVGQLGAEGTG